MVTRQRVPSSLSLQCKWQILFSQEVVLRPKLLPAANPFPYGNSVPWQCTRITRLHQVRPLKRPFNTLNSIPWCLFSFS